MKAYTKAEMKQELHSRINIYKTLAAEEKAAAEKETAETGKVYNLHYLRQLTCEAKVQELACILTYFGEYEEYEKVHL